MNKPRALTRSALRALPLPPVEDGDKESKGRILIVAGSRRTPGAALLAAAGAMRAGAGKLRMITVESIADATAVAMPEAMVLGLPEDRDGGFARSAIDRIRDQAERVDAVVAGPGLARAGSCEALAGALMECSAKLAFDAALLHSLPVPESKQPRPGGAPILLPHSGELAALLDCDEREIEEDPVRCGLDAARLYQANVLVKGVVSHVASPDGCVWKYAGGAPGLGVSGSGDVLAGIVGGMAARGADSVTALLWGVFLHGGAGEALARKVGPIGFLAREIPGEIPALLPR